MITGVALGVALLVEDEVALEELAEGVGTTSVTIGKSSRSFWKSLELIPPPKTPPKTEITAFFLLNKSQLRIPKTKCV